MAIILLVIEVIIAFINIKRGMCISLTRNLTRRDLIDDRKSTGNLNLSLVVR